MPAHQHPTRTQHTEDAEAPVLPLVSGWRFGALPGDWALAPDFDDSDHETVCLPHCVTSLSWRDWDPSSWEGRWLYRRRFGLPDSFAGRRVLLEFDGVLSAATPHLNGQPLPGHAGGYLPFRYEITDHLTESVNVLAVAIDARWLPVPPSGHPDGAAAVDYLQPGGIYRDVRLRAVPRTHIADVVVRPRDVRVPRERRADVACTIDADAPVPPTAVLMVEVRDGAETLARTEVPAGQAGPGEHTLRATVGGLHDIRLWDVTDPNLYHVVTTLVVDGAPVHTVRTRIGFREARFEPDGFFLNGRRLPLFGLNRHQLFPYTGMAMPDRVQRHDARILRTELNCTMVRCAHYPQSPAFLDACDELGLLVFEEVPGWQYLGDEQWQDLCVRDVRAMVRRDRNRPSVVLWGVQVNESPVAPELYARTRDTARALDPDRATTGAMLAAHHSTDDFVQDVFSYNDYTREDGEATLAPPLSGLPYLVSEAVGSLVGPHYYRRTDPQDVQARQAHLHALVHDIAASDSRYAGLLAWQAFDYQSMTGLVDHRLKCNGVADTFRVPKLGAAIYRSQVDPTVRPVIEPAFLWDLSPTVPEDGPGPAAMVCSNCERLEVYVDGRHHGTLHPDRDRFAHLDHPPFLADLSLDAATRERRPELRLEGYHGGRRVVVREFSADPAGDRLSLVADDSRLLADGIDATRVVFRVVDRHGASRPYAGGDLRLAVAGPGVIIGENPFPLGETGGVGAVWVRTRAGAPGRVSVTAEHVTLGRGTVEMTAVRDVRDA